MPYQCGDRTGSRSRNAGRAPDATYEPQVLGRTVTTFGSTKSVHMHMRWHLKLPTVVG